MTLLEKLDILLKNNGLNKRQFSIQSTIPYSTIDNWYKVGYEKMQLATFRTLCDFFGVTMDSMAYDDMEIVYKKDLAPMEFSPEEKGMIHSYRYLDEEGQKRVLYTLENEKRIEVEKKKDIASA